MHEPARRVRERIIATEVLRLDRRQALERREALGRARRPPSVKPPPGNSAR
jgi:hypothetical protein